MAWNWAPIRMQRPQPPIPVVGTAHALAVDRHDLAVDPCQRLPHPVPAALLEPARIQPCEDPFQRVVRGAPVRQFQEGAQPLFIELAEEGDGHKAIGAAGDGQYRQHQNVRQGCSWVRSTWGSSRASRSSTRDEGIGLFMRSTLQADAGIAHCSPASTCPGIQFRCNRLGHLPSGDSSRQPHRFTTHPQVADPGHNPQCRQSVKAPLFPPRPRCAKRVANHFKS